MRYFHAQPLRKRRFNKGNNACLPEMAEQRRRRVYRLRISTCMTYEEIAHKCEEEGLGTFSGQQAANYFKIEVANLREKHEQDALRYKIEQTERLNHVIQESLAAWEASKNPEHSTSTTSGRVALPRVAPALGDLQALGLANGAEDLIPLPDQVVTTERQQVGNAVFLQKAIDAMSEQRKIWGWDAAKKTDVTTSGQAIKAYIGVPIDEV